MKLKMILRKLSAPSLLAAFALSMSTLAANSECFYVFHQTELPKEIKKFRKF